MENNAKRSTPLPRLKVLIISSILFANVFGLMIIFPILPFITHDFFPELGKSELGYKQGYLGSSLNVVKLCCVFVWGRLSDMYGRRPTMLCGLMGSLICMLMFGFSESFLMACMSRFFWGLLNGNYAIATTYLSEILDDTNQAKGFTCIGIASALGRLAAPVVGGFLSQPAGKYPWLDTPLLRRFPYLLPCLFGVAVLAFSFIGAYKYLNETLDRSVPPTFVDKDDSAFRKMHQNHSLTYRTCRETKLILREILQPNTLLSIIVYSITIFITIMSSEVVALLMVTDFIHGGYCMDGNEIGLLFLLGAVFFLFHHVFLLSRIIKWLNYIKVIRVYLFIHLIVTLLLPFTTQITGPIPDTVTHFVNDSSQECYFSEEPGKEALNVDSIRRVPFLFWCLLFLIMSLLISTRNSLQTLTVLLIGNSSKPRHRAMINSFGQFTATISRVAGPAIGALLFAWSESSGLGYPFNYHLTFIVLGFVTMLVFILSFGWTKQVEIKKTSRVPEPIDQKGFQL